MWCGLATHSRQVLQRADAVLVLDGMNSTRFLECAICGRGLALVRVDDEDVDEEVVDAKDVIVSSTKQEGHQRKRKAGSRGCAS